ncbi:LOW QUALITY PROTEIN: hypothetical protein TorRG33x02_288610 [Trema orientale]|uniref:Uncharacterized protein n=1 Tax=Trema orientale TaxID=63057 RepID=A0A2P5CED9_TREOI|nr:LOW QUALITY PROTEIN: hypothetical protein TorRG33x02_288610 [Trema orientale]
MVIIMGRNHRPSRSRRRSDGRTVPHGPHVVPGPNGPTQNAPDGEQEIELLVPNLEQILIKLDGRVPREVEDALDEAAVLAEDLEGEAAAGEVVEDAGVVAGDIHAAAEAGEVDVDGGFLGVAAEDYGVGLHVVLEILAL